MKVTSFGGMAVVCLLAAGPFVADSAFAKASATMTTCSANYKAAKAAGTLPAGQTWPQYLSTCAGKLGGASTSAAATPALATPAKATPAVATPAKATPAVTATATPSVASSLKSLLKGSGKTAAPVAAAAAATGKAPTPGQQAMYDRERQCGAMWKTDKASGNIAAGETWPQYWSQCNARLKG